MRAYSWQVMLRSLLESKRVFHNNRHMVQWNCEQVSFSKAGILSDGAESNACDAKREYARPVGL